MLLFMDCKITVIVCIASILCMPAKVVNALNYPLAQPQIYLKNGHIYFIPAENKNVVLQARGDGKIIFNSVDLNNLTNSMLNSVKEVDAFKNIFGSPSSSSAQISSRVTSIEQTVQRLNQIETLDTRLTLVERRVATNNGSTEVSRSVNNRIRQLRRRIEAVENQLQGTGTSGGQNPCSSNPCLNGARCIPTLYGAVCYCTSGWEGARCDQDVNECANFVGTELGCQNGATCINQPGTYQCQCQNDYSGIHCTKRRGDCSSGSSWEMCGHGICVNQHSGPNAYTCICDTGWQRSEGSPTCMRDINECSSQYHATCSTNPPVMCINTQGSYVCGPCPLGYTGNGHQCMDINECLVSNGGCSVNPMVQCTNTVGSRSCGTCPPGYMGDGVTCQYVGICHVNNGGCYPTARCVENPVIGQSFVQCICPAGYTGSGMGLHGCMISHTPSGSGTGVQPVVAPGVNPCSSNPCQNGGVCHSYGGAGFTCSCVQGFIGSTCATRSDPCLSQPCQNGGICRSASAAGTTFTCTCSSEFTGDLCERQVESCGGILDTQEGTLRFPQTQSSYDHNTRCEWQLRTIVGKVLNVTFSSFHLEGGSSCSFDYVEIRDGIDAQSPQLGRFCGQELPQGGDSIFSTHNILHITFRSDHSIDGLGFALSWNTSEPVCGGVLQNQSHGSFSSPGYPGNYPHDRDCVWQIRAASLGKRLQLVFAAFRLETHPNCSYDYIEVRDGLEDNAPVLEKLCSDTSTPAPVTSTGPYLTVRFHSDDSSSAQGFLISYTEVPGIPGCGGLLTSATAVFSSPHHPQPYAHGLECDWLIRLPSRDDKISLIFLTFELERSYGGCVYDFVEVHDGSSLDSPLMGRFCGNSIPPSLKSSGNQMFVRFKSDESVALGGFSAKYEVGCGGEATTPSGILRSPYYPNNYPKHRDCVYVINQPAGTGINLQFQDFDIEPGTDTSCIFDYLEIRDGDTENSTLIGHYCGPPESAPPLITSSYNYLWLRFKTDGSVQNKGFLANYTTFETGCGGILRGSDGTITSPGHPEVYPHGVQCMWVIRGKPGEVVRLTWNTFNLESSTNCVWDVVEIYDNSTAFINGSLIGQFCGNDHPPQLTSTDTTMTIIFKSDHSLAMDGFSASYRFLNASTSCGGNYFTEYGVIKSPRYPQNYLNSKSCIWVITAPRGRQIELNFTDFEMEAGSGCRFDVLEIRNGQFSTSPLIGKFCGDSPPPTIIPSFSNSLYLKFKTDSSITRKGFNIIWDATSTGCGGILTNSPSGAISSPNYPSSSGGGLECLWKIKVNAGSVVQINFVDIDIIHYSGSSNCLRDRVEVFDGSDTRSRSLGKFCAEDHIISLKSTTNSITVKFVVGVFGGTGRGFKLNYRTGCNTVLKGLQGVIESPNFPNAYPHNRNCTWVIQASKGNKVNMSFSHFEVEAPFRGNCSYDFIQISEWKRSNPESKTILGTYCGTNRPRLVTSNVDTVSVSFVSDHSHAGNGFRLEWVQHGCGGRIVGSYGYLTSPGYPKKYTTDVECIWQVTTALGTKVQLTIYELDIEHNNNCEYDGLMVRGGPDENSPLITTICETIHNFQTHRELTSHGNTMYIKFYSDETYTAKGFSAYVYQIPGGCGGTFKTTSGFIHSPNYPGNYDQNEDCFWTITVDPNHVVELTFEEFDVARDVNCTNNYVTVYDTRWLSDSAPVLLPGHCGNSLPNPVTIKSTGSSMLVRLRTDGSSTVRKGFKARYVQGCGARLTEESGVISTPNFPGNPPRSINCSWIIVAPDSPDARISLTFTHILDFSYNDQNCSSSYIEVLDGEDSEAPSLYRTCNNGPLPPTLTSRGNAMIIRVFGEEYRGHGFRAVYSQSSSACGGEIMAANGSFISPNYPNGYPANAECIWTIKASPGNKVQLSFRRFELETSEFCNSDFVEIHEDSASGPLLGHYCGNDIPSNITVSKKIWILFRTDGEGQAPGFWADFNLLHGVELSGSSGEVSSPMYPFPFPGTGTFTWLITVNQSYAMQLSFDDYGLDSYENDDCEYSEKITIYDGYDINSPVLLRTCSQTTPDPVTSTGNVVFIEYYRTTWYNTFKLRWQQVQQPSEGAPFQTNITGCGGNYSLSATNATTLTSPRFPNSYQPNLNCEWNFDAAVNSKISLRVESFSLDWGGPSCLNDKVELYDGVSGLPTYELNKTICQYGEQNNTYLSSGRYLRVVFKTNEWWEGQGFNFTLKTACGGYMRDLRGVIASPNYPNNYVASHCIWNIVVRPGRTIRVAFNSSFGIYSGGGGQCGSDKLILRNGANQESPFIGSGRYCGNTAPAPLETFGNHLFVQFTSITEGGKGFSFTYEEVPLGCGGIVQLSHNAPNTTLQSPNFPQPPPPYTECEWVIQAPQGEAIQITFPNTFSVTTSSWRCDDAGVEIRDGGTHISPLLGTYCYNTPPTKKSTGNILYVRYYTNLLDQRDGLKADVKIATCGGTHFLSWGSADKIFSPGYPAAYDVNVDCVWTLWSKWYTFDLRFENFNLGGEDANCTRDKIVITRYQDNETALANIPARNWTVCGQAEGVLPSNIETGYNHIQIRFTSDGIRETQGPKIGFTIKYYGTYTDCREELRTPTGFIQSTSYPQAYPHYRYCSWKIIAPPGRRVRLEFIDFQMSEPIRTSGRSDCYPHGYFIAQHTDSYYLRRGYFYNQTICGSSLPAPVESTTGEVQIIYYTDGSPLNRGFKLRYTTDLPIICGGDLPFGTGNISSPNTTTATPLETNSLVCRWKTAAAPIGDDEGGSEALDITNGTIIVTIKDLRIPSWGAKETYCINGFVRFTTEENSFNWDTTRYCGSISNENVYFHGSMLYVEYMTTDTNSTFSLSYRTLPCGGKVDADGNITSLNYPSPYPVDTECIWIIDFPAEWNSGYGIKVTFFDLDMDDHVDSGGNCDRDYIVIRNGKYQTSPVLGQFCGSSMPNELVSMSNHMWIEFHSDGNGDGGRRGFSIGLEQATGNSCGGVLHTKVGKLGSPKIVNGSRYQHNMECEWIIETVLGYVVNLVFHGRFDIETSTNCTNDYVEVFSKLGLHWNSLGKFCGRQLPPSINTTSTSVRVIFKSNQNLNGDGFTLYWYSLCGGVFDQSAGVIRSAHLSYTDQHYNLNTGRYWTWVAHESYYKVNRCDYLVKTNPQDYVVLRFVEPFQVVSKSYNWLPEAKTTACPFVNVTLWQGNSTMVQRQSRTVCGTEVPFPQPYIAIGSAVISYNYRPTDQVYGFRVEYSTYDCGGNITSPQTLRSPGHPFTASANMNCTWVVTAPENQVVRFRFKFLEMEPHSHCAYDYVKLFNGAFVDYTKLIGTYCGNMTTDMPSISSQSRNMTIQAYTDYIIQHGGFEATVDFTLGEAQGCGGVKNISSAPVTISSVDGNGAPLDCQWLLVAPEFKSIEILFTNFTSLGQQTVGTNETCPFHYLEIRDGPGPYGPLLGKLCGNSLPPRTLSSQNFMWIQFVTDGSPNSLRFSFTATSRESPCGELVLNANDTIKYLQSPGYPSNYESNVRCRWRIDAVGRYDEVDITFEEMDIETASNCQKDRLEIRDLASSYLTPEGISGSVLFTGTPRLPWHYRHLNLSMASILQDILYCGSQTPADFFSIGRSAELMFSSDGDGNRKGFKIGYKVAGCNRAYENLQGRIFSPKWPGYAPYFSNCLSSIRAPNGSQIALYFNSFRLPAQQNVSTSSTSSCTDGAFEVFESAPTGPILASYCGETIPNPVFSNSSVLYLKFTTRWQHAFGYDITYTTTDMGRGCGGDIFHTGGSFTSPLYPGNYSLDSDCRWRVRVPGGLQIQIQFTNFFLGGSCQTDFVEILSMDSHDTTGAAPVLFSRYCSGDTPSTYTGSTDMAMVRYKTSVNNTGPGWRATFKGIFPTDIPVSSQ